MVRRLFALAIILLVFVGGCAPGPPLGGAGEVSGPLRSIELYTQRPKREEPYLTAARERFYASDREVYVLAVWSLPGPGDYVSKVALRTPAGSVHGEREYRFRAETPSWITFQRLELPQGEAAQALSGPWHVEVALGGTSVGKRAFTFDPSNIRLRTDGRLVILQGKVDSEARSAGYYWRERYGAMESAKSALAMLGVALRDELARRFAHVDGPRRTSETSDATVLLTPTFLISPNPSMDSHLELEAVHVPTKTVREFHLKTAVGVERGPTESAVRSFNAAAADLALQAASSPEVLEFLVSVTQAVPEQQPSQSRVIGSSPGQLPERVHQAFEDYRSSPRFSDFKAFAYDESSRRWGSAWGYYMLKRAIERALQECRKEGRDCRLYAIGNTIVWDMLAEESTAVAEEYLARTAEAAGFPRRTIRLNPIPEVGQSSPAGTRLSSEEIRSYFHGNRLEGSSVNGFQFTVEYSPDGTTTGQAGRIADTGTWTIEKDSMCLQWRLLNDAQKYCLVVLRDGDTLRSYDQTGQAISRARVPQQARSPGN